eukprot:187658-Pelagomonas_calceolata.AAC.1
MREVSPGFQDTGGEHPDNLVNYATLDLMTCYYLELYAFTRGTFIHNAESRGYNKGDKLAQKSRESSPSQSYNTESAYGDLEGYWKLPSLEPDCEK